MQNIIITIKNHNEKIRKSRLGKKASEKTKLKMRISSSRSKPVQCIETKKTYFSINEAGRQTNIDPSAIIKVCKGKYKTAGGYHWKYV